MNLSARFPSLAPGDNEQYAIYPLQWPTQAFHEQLRISGALLSMPLRQQANKPTRPISNARKEHRILQRTYPRLSLSCPWSPCYIIRSYMTGAKQKTGQTRAHTFILWRQRSTGLLLPFALLGATLSLNACGGGSGDARNAAGGGGFRGLGGSGSSEEVELDSATVLDSADQAAALSDEDLSAAIAAADLDAEVALAGPSGLVRELGSEVIARATWAGIGTQMKTASDEFAAGTLFANTKTMSYIQRPGTRVQADGGGSLGEAFGAGWLGGSLFNAFFVESVINDYSGGKSGLVTNSTSSGDIAATAALTDTAVQLDAIANFSLQGLRATIKTHSQIPCPDVNGLVTVNSYLDVTGRAGDAIQQARFTFELTAEVDEDANLTGKNQLKSRTQTHTEDSKNGYDATNGSVDISITQFSDGHFGDGKSTYKGTTEQEAIGWMSMGLMSGILYRNQLLPNLQKMLDAGRCVTITVEPSVSPMNLQPSANVDLLTEPRAKLSNSGVTARGTVQAKFKKNAGGSIVELGDKVPADATFHYLSPPDYKQTETVTFEARSRRGTGKLDYTLTTSPHAD